VASLTGLLEPRQEDLVSLESRQYFELVMKDNSADSLPPSYSSVALGKYIKMELMKVQFR
jgi:hypothetical protein